MKTYLSEQDPKRPQTNASANHIPVAQGKGLPARPVQLASAPMQQKEGPIQREEKTDEKKKKEGDKPSGFKHDIKFLPPALQLKYWFLTLDADTQKTILSLKKDEFHSTLSYTYGKDLSLMGKYGGLSGDFGINPGTKDMKFSLGVADSLKFKGNYSPDAGTYGVGASGEYNGYKAGLDYKSSGDLSGSMSYGKFSLGGSGNFHSGAYGLSASYGGPLAPMPMDLSDSVNGGVAGLHGFVGGMPGDPVGMYNHYGSDGQKDNIDAMKKAGKDVHGLYKQGDTLPFAGGASLSKSPDMGTTFMLRLQGHF